MQQRDEFSQQNCFKACGSNDVTSDAVRSSILVSCPGNVEQNVNGVEKFSCHRHDVFQR
jgi:hypothetical protein